MDSSTAFGLAADSISQGGALAARAKSFAGGDSKHVNPAKLRKSAEDFEAFFVTSMMEQMFSGIETDGPFGGGQGEAVFRSLLNQEYGKAIASSGGIGIADMVQRQMLALQEAQG